MLKLRKHTLTAGTLLVAVSLAAPAMAGTLYRWQTADGSLAFTDDPDHIPAAYRSQAKAFEARGLARYERFTPEDDAARSAHEERLYSRLERLREANAAAERSESAAPAAVGAAPGSETIVQVNDDTAVRVPLAGSDEGPLVVEEVRVKRRGSLFTIHDTVVRRGDQVLLVVRPAEPHQAGPNDFIDEDELLE